MIVLYKIYRWISSISWIVVFNCSLSLNANASSPMYSSASELYKNTLISEQRCLDSKILNEVMRTVGISYQTGYKVDLCNLEDPFTRGLLALMMLYESKIKMPDSKKSYFDFLIDKVSFIRFSLCESEPTADAFTEPDSREAKDIFFCLDKINRYSLIYLMSTFIHEARHLEQGDSAHVECTRGINKGLKSCDRSLTELKTIGTQFCLLKKVRVNSLFTEKAQKDANYYMQGIRDQFVLDNIEPSCD